LEYQWTGKRVGLKVLKEKIEELLRKQKFNVKRKDDSKGTYLHGVSHIKGNNAKHVSIKIFGTPDDFTVKFEGGERLKEVLKISSLIYYLGGGLVLLKAHKTAELYKQLEEEFWRNMDKIVSELTDTA